MKPFSGQRQTAGAIRARFYQLARKTTIGAHGSPREGTSSVHLEGFTRTLILAVSDPTLETARCTGGFACRDGVRRAAPAPAVIDLKRNFYKALRR
jgi:hypothetical protein